MAGTRKAWVRVRLRYWLRAVGGMVLVAWFLADTPVRGREPGGGPPGDRGPPARFPIARLAPAPIDSPASSAASPTNASPAVDPWHENLIRERQVEIRLRAALRELDDGRLVAGLTALQAIIDRDDDVLVRLESEPIPCGAGALANRRLGSISSEVRGAYEALYGAQARQLFDSARASSDLQALARIVRRFYHTAAGFDAGNRLAAYWSDHACDELAWSWWRRVLAEPGHRERMQPAQYVQAAWCCRRLGRDETARAILEALPGDQSVTLGGRNWAIRELSQRLARVPVVRGSDADALVVAGRIDRNGIGSGSAPALTRPLWQSSLAGEHTRQIETLARTWEARQLQTGLPVGTGQFPLLVGQRLIYRDFEGLRAVDVSTGRLLWFYPCASSIWREVAPRQPASPDGNPDNVMRHVVGNSILGTLASDGTRIFAIDRLEADESVPAAPPGVPPAALRQTNTLAAFELATEGPENCPKWTAGGRETTSGRIRALEGHYFLGPPLPVDDRLFTVSECNQQIHLSCLGSETGNLFWSQVLCSVAQPIGIDQQRSALACSPSYSDGIVVCPTQAGVLVAVDALAGRLLWAASHDDVEPQQRQQMSGWPYSARRRFGHPGYVNLPVIHGSRVVYLPSQSEHVHCLDLATGRWHWRAPREDLEPSTATEYVAAVTDGSVVIVGRRKCRGLLLDTGSERWAVRLGSSTAGRGVCLNATYHVPLDDGRIVSLELDSGRHIIGPPAPGETRLGNLVAGRDLIVSLGASEIAVYPQAHRVLQTLEAELAGAPPAVPQVLQAAELELALGQFDRAEKRLAALVKHGDRTPEAARITALLRQVLTSRLGAAGSDEQALLERLAGLSAEDADRGRYLFELCRVALNRSDARGALTAARELSSLNLAMPLEPGDDPSRKAASEVLAASLFRTAGCPMAPSVRELEKQVLSDMLQAPGAHDTDSARRLIRVCRDAGAADAARLQLADLLVGQQRLQQAELVLLACRESQDAEICGPATRRLAELWIKQGLYHDAARLFEELAVRFADTEVAPDQCGGAWLAAVPHDSPAFEAYRQFVPPVWSPGDVRIIENRAPSEALQAIYNGNTMPTPRQSPFDLVDKGHGAGADFGIIDRHTGRQFPEAIRVPGRYFYPASTQSGYLQHSYVGHFFPLGGAGTLHGVSLLERRLLWTTVPPGLAGVKEVVLAGPAGPGFCTFQHRQHLYVVDPVDGNVLWHRDDLETASGLMSEPYLGIIGDERVLIVFASNGANYTAYETASGAEIRRGKLDIQPRLQRRSVGRRLFHYTLVANNRRLRVWDALADRFVWDEPADRIAEASVLEGVPPGTKVLTFVRDTNEAAFATNSGRVQVVDLSTGNDRLDMAVEPQLLENLSFLRAFRDQERYYFNLQRTFPPGGSPSVPGYAVNDAALPCVHVEGDLCAVDIKTGRTLWRRSLGKRSLLQLADAPLPVLVSLSRIRKQDQSFLAVEVLDVQTGQTLASREDLLSDRLLQASYDRQEGRIELRGAKTAIRLEFPVKVAGLSAGGPGR